MLRKFIGLFKSQKTIEINSLYEQGKRFVEQGKLHEAKENFLKISRLDPNCEGAKYRLLNINKQLEVLEHKDDHNEDHPQIGLSNK